MGAPPVELKKGLKQRHLTMIAMGGVIGAGLFVGSGVVISETGPPAFISYALSGLIVIMVMRMLGEMAVANPSTGSFADYARDALGGWAGFSVGWLYWYFWVIVIGFEAVAGGKVVQFWAPGIPLWLLSLVLMSLMTATNLFSVSSFGEFEFWFAGIKVAAIVLFLVMGALFVVGAWPNKGFDFSNLTAHGGFFPAGSGAIFAAILVVIFSMTGAEVATIAAAESHDPGQVHRQGDQLGDRADRGVLRRFDLPACRDPAVELQAPGRLALRRRLPGHEHPRRRRHHERGGADGGAVMPELRPVHVLADAVRAGRSSRGADDLDDGQQERVSRRAAILRLVRRGLPVRDRGGASRPTRCSSSC